MRERAMDGLEAFRVNRLRREADAKISDKWVRFFESDPHTHQPISASADIDLTKPAGDIH